MDNLVEIFTGNDELPIRAAAFSPDGAYFATGSNSKKLTIYSIESIINSYVSSLPHSLRMPTTLMLKRWPKSLKRRISAQNRYTPLTGQPIMSS